MNEFKIIIKCKNKKYEDVVNELNIFVKSLVQEFMYEEKKMGNRIIHYYIFFYYDIYTYIEYNYCNYDYQSTFNCNDDYKKNYHILNEISIKYDNFEETEALNYLIYKINEFDTMISFSNM